MIPMIKVRRINIFGYYREKGEEKITLKCKN
jgi:hypothetical protein